MNEYLCNLCPRECRIDRSAQKGFCGAPPLPTVAKAMLHKWEEPCICYGGGSGAVFFSGCQLKCVFCQNQEISRAITGKEMDVAGLADLFLSLAQKGACNINLVSPTPYLNTVIPALTLAKEKGLEIPIVMNSGGYESVEALKRLEGLVDVYLPDFKFSDPLLSARYAKAENYAEKALEAISEMQRQVGAPRSDGDRLLSGVIVRHLVLPGCSADSVKILTTLAERFAPDGIILSLMQQYTPMVDATHFPELDRKITSLEYNRVVKAARSLGFTDVYTQSKESIGEKFIPDFSVFFDEKN